MNRPQQLENVGVVIHPETVWLGTPGVDRRQEKVPDTLSSIFLPLSAEEWCSIAMREGENYVGGCCGNMGVLQDTINEIFRNSGCADNSELLTVYEMAKGHDGFDTFEELNEPQFSELLERWEHLDGWEKIGLICNGVEPMLKPKQHEGPSNYSVPPEERDIIHVLHGSLARLSWQGLFTREGDEAATHEANRLTALAKILPLTQQLLEQLENSTERFEGYALASPETGEILYNAYGLCFYHNLEAAQKMGEIWQRMDESPAYQIRELVVTVADGAVLGDVIAE